jgi:hypothetical protein
MRISDLICIAGYHDTIDIGQDGFLRQVFNSLVKISLCDDHDREWLYTEIKSSHKYYRCIDCKKILFVKKLNKRG